MKNRVLCAILLSVTLTSPSQSSELGNIFGDPTLTDASKNASVVALLALEEALAALRQREKGDTNGEDALKNAISNLTEASKAMRGLIDSGLPDFDLSEQEIDRVQRTFSIQGGRNDGAIVVINTFAKLYSSFVSTGDELVISLQASTGISLDEPIFPKFAELLARYLLLGSLVTEFSRSRLN